VDHVLWQQSPDQRQWATVARNPSNDSDHAYTFNQAGVLFVRIIGVNTAGTGVSGLERRVNVRPNEEVATLQPYEVNMTETKIVAIKGPGGKLGRMDKAGTGPFASLGWHGVLWDKLAPDDSCTFEFSMADAGYKFKHIATGALLGIDATIYSGDIGSQFYGKPGNDHGRYEAPSVYKSPKTGMIVGFVEYEDGLYPSCAFSVLVLP
jgi:hypothetical protein